MVAQDGRWLKALGRVGSPGASHAGTLGSVPLSVAVVPVAGLGTRLLPATKSQRKEMLPVGVDRGALGELMATNVARRVALYDPDPRHLALVEIARACGTHANFAGSGGAVVGPCPDEATFARLQEAYAREGCAVLRPTVG